MLVCRRRSKGAWLEQLKKRVGLFNLFLLYVPCATTKFFVVAINCLFVVTKSLIFTPKNVAATTKENGFTRVNGTCSNQNPLSVN